MPNPAPRTLTHDGLTLTLKEWARRTGIEAETIRSRIDHQGYSVARALTTPVAKKFARRRRPIAAEDRTAPRMLYHKATNRAYAKWHAQGKEQIRYFGPWLSAEAEAAYRRFQAEWAAGVRSGTPGHSAVTVLELAAGYLKHVTSYYVKDGQPTSEQGRQRSAVKILTQLYATLPVTDFKPRHLKACQQAMIAQNLARVTVNLYTWAITRCFSWGVAEELVPAAVADALAHVPNLQPGRTAAPDSEPVMSVPSAVIEATLTQLDADPARRAVLEAMIRFQLLVGCRPGELCAMTAAAVDTTGDAWVYRAPNKNLHRQTKRKPRLVWIGPRAQAILQPFLEGPGPGGRLWCFPPRWPDSEKARRVPISINRYAECVRRACRAARVEAWTPHQLRHNRATEVQRIYESNAAAAAVIGDTEQVLAEVYADPNEAVARRIALATG